MAQAPVAERYPGQHQPQRQQRAQRQRPGGQGRRPGHARAAGLPPRPTQFKAKGHAQVWTVAGTTFPLAVISGRDAAAILALQRGLPHYGSQSWLVFEQGRAIDKGVWPARVPEIKVTRARGTK